MHWLSKQPAFGKSREFEITTRSVGRNTMETAGDVEDDEDESESFSHGTPCMLYLLHLIIDSNHVQVAKRRKSSSCLAMVSMLAGRLSIFRDD